MQNRDEWRLLVKFPLNEGGNLFLVVWENKETGKQRIALVFREKKTVIRDDLNICSDEYFEYSMTPNKVFLEAIRILLGWFIRDYKSNGE